jgi:uncharacterized Zn finger protein (UPF0148 family)
MEELSGGKAMSQTENRKNLVTSADLIRRGATLLQEPCPRCGGVQVRYQGKVYCLNEDNLDSVINPQTQQQQQQKKEEEQPRSKGQLLSKRNEPAELRAEKETKPSTAEVPYPQSSPQLRKLLEEKLNSVSRQLDATVDLDEQARLLDLINKYLETLEKLK